MITTEPQFIRERCLGLIRASSMRSAEWEWTVLDRCHDFVATQVTLLKDEYPLVSFFVGPGDWTLYTTHRMIGSVAGLRSVINHADFKSADFGNFKQDLASPQVAEAIIHGPHGPITFLYETGYASMAPIHYFKFWNLKWPACKETLRIENQKAVQRVDGPQKS